MSYAEKRKIVSMSAGLLIMAAYCINVIGKIQSGVLNPNDFQALALTMLLFIGISIVIMIVIQILFHILMAISIAAKETITNGNKTDAVKIDKAINTSFVEDEMDKLIDLKSSRFGYVLSGFGMIAGLITLACGLSPAIMLHVVFGSCFLATFTEGVLSIVYYRRGIKNGG